MAAANCNKASIYSAIVMALLFTFSFTEGMLTIEAVPAASPSCRAVYGTKSGDTCFGVSQMFNLTPAEFSAINPNLNCDHLFVGQWLCVDGTV